MTRIIILATALLSAPAHADTTWRCDGVVTSSGTCIGSERNTAPPVVYCAPDSSDPRCWRGDRRT